MPALSASFVSPRASSDLAHLHPQLLASPSTIQNRLLPSQPRSDAFPREILLAEPDLLFHSSSQLRAACRRSCPEIIIVPVLPSRSRTLRFAFVSSRCAPFLDRDPLLRHTGRRVGSLFFPKISAFFRQVSASQWMIHLSARLSARGYIARRHRGEMRG